MTIPLMILAVLSVIGGYIGIPSVLGGANHFEHFLEPIFHAPPVTHEIAERGGHALELLLMSGTTAAAVLGFLLAWLLYYRRPELPDRIASAAGMVYRFVLNKYYVDELYRAVFVKPLIEGSTKLLWHGIDTATIDNAINGSAHGAQELSDTVRHMQSGNIRSYAGWVALGAALVVAYVIWMGVR